MFFGVGAVGDHFECVLRVLHQTCEDSGILIVRNVVGHLNVNCIKYNIRFSLVIAFVAGPADGGTICGDIGCFGSRGFVAGGHLLNNEIVHKSRTSVLAFTTQDDVAGAAERYRELVCVPTSIVFGSNNSTVGLGVVTIEEAKFCGSCNFAVLASIHADTFGSVGSTLCVT